MLTVLKHQYVFVTAFVQKQNGPTEMLKHAQQINKLIYYMLVYEILRNIDEIRRDIFILRIFIVKIFFSAVKNIFHIFTSFSSARLLSSNIQIDKYNIK